MRRVKKPHSVVFSNHAVNPKSKYLEVKELVEKADKRRQSQIFLEEYDPLRKPPNIEQAIKHAKASRVGMIDETEKVDNCACCGLNSVIFS